MANDLKEKEYNPSQDDYKDKFDSGSNSGSSTGSSGYGGHDGTDGSDNLNHDSSNPDLGKREAKPDKNEDSNLAQQQAKDEGVGGSNLYDPSGAQQHHKPSTQARLKGMFSGRKKAGWIGGGIIAALLGGFLSFFPVLGPIHIMSNLFDHNFEYNDSFRRNRTGKLVRSILSYNKDTTRTLRDTPFLLKADLVEFEKFEVRMKSQGWGFEYNADGKATGIIDPDGNSIDLTDANRAEFNRRVQPIIDDTVPAWRMNKRVRTRSLISTFTGPRKSFVWSKLFGRDKSVEPNFEAAKFKKETGLDQPNVADRVTINERIETVNEAGDTVVTETELDSGGDVNGAQQAVIDAKLSGAGDAEALAIGSAELNKISSPKAGRTSVIIGSLIASCIAHAAYENQLSSQYERYASSLRFAGTAMLTANEIQQGGDIDVGEVGQHFSEYNNFESNTVEIDTGDGIEKVEYGTGSFSSSAAWQRATGAPVTGEEISNEYRVHPDETTGALGVAGGVIADVVTRLGGAISAIPGMNLLCNVINSGLGVVIGFAFDALEGLAAIAACFTGAGCIALGKFAVAELLFEMGSRLLAASLTAFVGYLITNPQQALAVLDQALNLTSSEESRTGLPVDDQRYNQEVAQFKRSQNQGAPLLERYFALDNPNSITASLARAKINLGQLNPAQFIASLFNLPSNAVVAVASSGNVYAQTDIDFDNYDFQKYSYNTEYQDSDPFVLAEEVSEMIGNDEEVAQNSSDVGVADSLARDFAVLCMGYNPQTELVNKLGGTQMLPMFSDPSPAAFGPSEAERRNNLYKSLCVEAASSEDNRDLYTKVGRFVGDIELVSSIIELTGEEVPTTSGFDSGNSSPDAPTPGPTPPDPTPDPTPPVTCDEVPIGDLCLD